MGFITDLPTSLVAAFRATLEEVLAADLILHVRDISHPDAEAQKRDVETVLAELGVDAGDRAGASGRGLEQDRPVAARSRWSSWKPSASGHADISLVSAALGSGVDGLLRTVDRRLAAKRSVVEFDLDYNSGEIARLAAPQRGGAGADRRRRGPASQGSHLNRRARALAHKLGRPV